MGLSSLPGSYISPLWRESFWWYLLPPLLSISPWGLFSPRPKARVGLCKGASTPHSVGGVGHHCPGLPASYPTSHLQGCSNFYKQTDRLIHNYSDWTKCAQILTNLTYSDQSQCVQTSSRFDLFFFVILVPCLCASKGVELHPHSRGRLVLSQRR